MSELEERVGGYRDLPSDLVIGYLKRFIANSFKVSWSDLAKERNSTIDAARDVGFAVCHLLTRLELGEISEKLNYKKDCLYGAIDRIPTLASSSSVFDYVYDNVLKRVTEEMADSNDDKILA